MEFNKQFNRFSRFLPTVSDLVSYVESIKRRTSIAVLYSANPDDEGVVVERTRNSRSWKSYREVAVDIAEALGEQGFQKVETLAEGPLFRRALEQRTFQLFWINSAGVQGRSPMTHAAALLESLGYSYIGHTPLLAALLDDKVLMKQWLRGMGLPTAPFIVRAPMGGETVRCEDSDYVREFGIRFRGPYLVKPSNGRGSVLVDVADDLETLNHSVKRVSQITGDRVIVEEFLHGQEYCVWAGGGVVLREGRVERQLTLQLFGHSERLYLDRDRIFRKDSFGDLTPDVCRPLGEREQRLKEDLSFLARGVYLGLGLCVPIRIDARVGADGLLQILEINPKPDLKKPRDENTGLLSTALMDLGLGYNGFIQKIVYDWLNFQLRTEPAFLASILPQLLEDTPLGFGPSVQDPLRDPPSRY